MPLTCKYMSLTLVIRKLKQQLQLRKHPLNIEFAQLQTLLGLFHLVQFDKCWQFFLEVNSKRLDQSSGKEKGSRCLVCTSSTKRENRHFYVVVVQRRLRNVQKSVIHVQTCCFANLSLLLFCRSRFRYRRRRLSSQLKKIGKNKREKGVGSFCFVCQFFFGIVTCLVASHADVLRGSSRVPAPRTLDKC